MSTKHTAESRKPRTAKAAIAALACCLVFAGLLVGCQPQKAESNETVSPKNTENTLPGNFLNNDSGYLDESFFASDYINEGNRGCNSCHKDLYPLIENTNPLPHLLGPARYGKDYTWNDCTTCHNMKNPFGGVALGDVIHASHYSNEAFVNDYAGNCFSCHATNAKNELVMYDVYKYSADFGGYQNSGSPMAQLWNSRRGFTQGTISGWTPLNNINLDVELSQPVIENEEDLYVVNNYEIPEITEEDYRFTVKGTVEEREFTLAELKALPATEMQVTQCCMTNPINSSLIASWPVKGVLLEDIIEACGGLAEGNTSVAFLTGDNWEIVKNLDVQAMIDHKAIVAYEFFGHELTPEWGYPAVTVVPGYGASRWAKWATGFEFSNTPGAEKTTWDNVDAMPDAIQGAVCSGWFNPVEDGTEIKVGETLELRGYAYVMNVLDSRGTEHALSQIAFSADRGSTWQTIDVPENYDPTNWTCFTAPWTPDKPGTYTLQVKAIDKGGHEQYMPANVIVNVVE